MNGVDSADGEGCAVGVRIGGVCGSDVTHMGVGIGVEVAVGVGGGVGTAIKFGFSVGVEI